MVYCQQPKCEWPVCLLHMVSGHLHGPDVRRPYIWPMMLRLIPGVILFLLVHVRWSYSRDHTVSCFLVLITCLLSQRKLNFLTHLWEEQREGHLQVASRYCHNQRLSGKHQAFLPSLYFKHFPCDVILMSRTRICTVIKTGDVWHLEL